MAVDAQHKQYIEALPQWQYMDLVIGASRDPEALGNAHLRKLNPKDETTANIERNKNYRGGAQWVAYTEDTENKHAGTAFAKKPECEVPGNSDYIKQDADGQGISISQMARADVRAGLRHGRGGLLVDFPATDAAEGLSRAETDLLGLRATIQRYSALNIVNWRTQKSGSSVKLSLVVLREVYVLVAEDGFSSETKEQYRELALIDGAYQWQLWRKQGDKPEWQPQGFNLVTDGAGEPFDTIPFVFIGAEANVPDIGSIPLLPLARINVGHYQNSADYEHNAHWCGHGVWWISGLDDEWRDALAENPISLDAQDVVSVPKDGDFGVTQMQNAPILEKALESKERQMKQIGARMTERGSAVNTLKQADNEALSEHSVLSLLCENVSAAYTQALQWVVRFNTARLDSSAGDIKFQIDTEFVQEAVSIEEGQLLRDSVVAGVAPLADYIDWLKAKKLVNPERKTQEIIEELEAQGKDLPDVDFNEGSAK